MSLVRSRWAAVGAAVAVTLGAGGIGYVSATNPSGASAFVPITPCRLVDTRPDSTVGAKNTPLGAEETHTVLAHGDNGQCVGIPAGATGLGLNVTAVGANAPTFLTIFPSGVERPTTSSLNPVPGGAPTPNGVTTDLSANGRFNIYNLAGQVDVVVDVTGYYTDHDHDDRYYTESEIDDITTLTPVAGGFINADGSVFRGVGIESSTFIPGNATFPNPNRYEIAMTGIDYTAVEFITSVTASCPGNDASTVAEDGNLIVYVEQGGDSFGACSFSFSVTPLPSG
jgi:hypothetical protein